jgi:hypothetical protein
MNRKRAQAVVRGVLLVSAMAVAIAAPAAAQKPTFDIDGVVTDAQQGVLPGATVTLKNVATGLSRETATDATVATSSRRCRRRDISCRPRSRALPPSAART